MLIFMGMYLKCSVDYVHPRIKEYIPSHTIEKQLKKKSTGDCIIYQTDYGCKCVNKKGVFRAYE